MNHRCVVLTLMLAFTMLFSVNGYADSGFTIERKLAVEDRLKTIDQEYFTTILYYYPEEDLAHIAKIVWAEAGNQPYEGKIAVAKVIFNRIENDGWGDDVWEVTRSASQFNGIKRKQFGYFEEEDLKAVYEAFYTNKYPSNLVYFANPNISGDRRFIENVLLPNKYVEIGQHVFSTNPRLPAE